MAKALALPFIDTDIQLQTHLGETLQHYIDRRGYLALRDQEEACILDLAPQSAIVATGGSAVYSDTAIRHLETMSRVVFLEISFDVMALRLGDFMSRGIAADRGCTLQDIYTERQPLYAAATSHRVDAEQSVGKIVDDLKGMLV